MKQWTLMPVLAVAVTLGMGGAATGARANPVSAAEIERVLDFVYAMPRAGQGLTFTIDADVTDVSGRMERYRAHVKRNRHIMHLRFEEPVRMRHDEILLRGNHIFHVSVGGTVQYRSGGFRHFNAIPLAQYAHILFVDPAEDHAIEPVEPKGGASADLILRALSRSNIFETISITLAEGKAIPARVRFHSHEDDVTWIATYRFEHLLPQDGGPDTPFVSRIQVSMEPDGGSAVLTFGAPQLIDASRVPNRLY